MIFAFCGAAIGLAAWGFSASAAYALAMLVLLTFSASRIDTAVLFGAYFIGGAVPPLWVALGGLEGHFFKPEALATLSCWLIVLTLPWLLWPGKNAPLRSRLVGGFGALAASILPPFGAASIMNPVLGLGWLAPASGVVGVVTFAAAWGIILVTKPRVRLAILLLLLASIFVLPHRIPAEDSTVVAISSRESAIAATSRDEDVRRITSIAQIVRTRPDVERVFVWPEWHLDAYEKSYDEVFESALRPELLGRSVLIGALVSRTGERRSGALLIDEERVVFVDQRQPLPFSLWRPGLDGHFPSHWTQNPIVRVSGRRALLIFCSEELSPLWSWWQLAFKDPDNIIVLASHRWTADDGIEDFTARHSTSSALLFGVPLARAIHYGSDNRTR